MPNTRAKRVTRSVVAAVATADVHTTASVVVAETQTRSTREQSPVEESARPPRKKARTGAVTLTEEVVVQASTSVVTSIEAASSVPVDTEPPPKAKKTTRKKKVVEPPKPSDYPARISTPWKVGAHVSAAGGVENAIVNAAAIGANAFALFLKSQRKWEAPPLTPGSIAAFKARLAEFGYKPKHVLPHGNYLINLGNPDADKREKSYQCFVDELKRCEQLGLMLYNFHPGSTVGQSTPSESLTFIAESINRAHKETSSVVAVIENMAGAGNVLGGPFAELAEIIKQVEDKTRVGVCIDTCHAFAAGYDMRTREGWTAAMTELEQTVGPGYLRGMHLNDSKTLLGSHKDRHDNIGQGHLGIEAFAHILADPRTRDIPLVLETPNSDDDKAVWATEIGVLNRMAVAGESGGELRLDVEKEEIKVVVGRAAKGKAAKEGANGKKRGKVGVEEEGEDGDGEEAKKVKKAGKAKKVKEAPGTEGRLKRARRASRKKDENEVSDLSSLNSDW